MADENEPGSTVVIVDAGDQAPVVIQDGEQVGGSAEVAAAGEVVNAAVEIARIEAERDVNLAELAIVETEVRHEAYSNEEAEQWRLTAARLEGENTALRAEVEALKTPLILELSPEPPPSPPLEVVAEEPDPALAENLEAVAPPPEPAPRKSKPLRWI